MNKLKVTFCLIFCFFTASKSLGQTSYEQLAVNYFFDSVFNSKYPGVKKIEFNGVTKNKLTHFSFYEKCFTSDSIRSLLAESSDKFEGTKIKILVPFKGKIRKHRGNWNKILKMDVYSVNKVAERNYVRIDFYIKHNFMDSYIFEFDSAQNIIGQCKMGVTI